MHHGDCPRPGWWLWDLWGASPWECLRADAGTRPLTLPWPSCVRATKLQWGARPRGRKENLYIAAAGASNGCAGGRVSSHRLENADDKKLGRLKQVGQ